jgi:hypothetical protein
MMPPLKNKKVTAKIGFFFAATFHNPMIGAFNKPNSIVTIFQKSASKTLMPDAASNAGHLVHHPLALLP